MTTTIMCYRTGDIIALVLQPEKNAGMVCENQEEGSKHVKVFRNNQPAPEFLRTEDITHWTGTETADE